MFLMKALLSFTVILIFAIKVSDCAFVLLIDASHGSFVGNRELCGKQIQICKSSGGSSALSPTDLGKIYRIRDCSFNVFSVFSG